MNSWRLIALSAVLSAVGWLVAGELSAVAQEAQPKAEEGPGRMFGGTVAGTGGATHNRFGAAVWKRCCTPSGATAASRSLRVVQRRRRRVTPCWLNASLSRARRLGGRPRPAL